MYFQGTSTNHPNFLISFANYIIKEISLIHIGIAAALGQYVTVPYITNFLTSSYTKSNLDNPLPFSCPLKTLLMLDAHNHPRYPTGLVENYMLDWWAASVIKPSPELLSHETLDKCLLVHHKQREAEMASARSAEVAMDMAPQASILERLGQLPTCKCCNLYRNLAVGTGEDVQHLYRELKRLDQEVANQTASTKRRASAFNRLFEAAVLKETHDT
jgi:hypothetical protein